MIEQIKSLSFVYKVGLVVIVLFLISSLATWYKPAPNTLPIHFTPAPPISGTKNIPKEDKKTSTGKVKVIPKGPLGGKVPLPPEVKDNSSKEVTATATAPASETPTDIISVIDMTTGDTTISTKPQPRSLIEFESKKRLGVGYGVGTSGTVAKVFGEVSFLRVGNVHLGLQAEVEAVSAKAPEGKAMAVIDYRW